MIGFALGSVIIYRGIRSPFVFGNYKISRQWKPIKGSFSLLEVRSIGELFNWWIINVPKPYGIFKVRKAGNLKPITGKGKKGFIEVTKANIKFNDRRCTLFRYLKKIQDKRLVKEW